MRVDSMQHLCSSLADATMKTGLGSNQFIPTSSCTSYVIIEETIESQYVLRVRKHNTSKHALAGLGDERACTSPAYSESMY